LPVAFMMLGSTKDYWNDPVLAKDVDGARNRHFEWLGAMPLKKGLTPLSLTDPDNERWFFDMLTHAKYDDFWKKVPLWQPVEYFDKYKDIPSYYVGGWYDVYREESFYTALSKRKKGPIKLLIGPWLHGGFGNGQTYSGDIDFGPEANTLSRDYFEVQLRWFDQTLKGRNTGVFEEPPIKIFVMGGGDGHKNRNGRLNHGGRWRMEKNWPLTRAKNTEYYFHGDGTLSTSRLGDEEPSVYLFNPANPVPTIGGSSYFYDSVDNPPYVPMGAYDQRENPDYFGCKTNLPLSARHDVLVFRTPTLEEDTELTVPLFTKLWVSSSAVDTDFTAKLIDFYPPTEDYPEGYAMNLSDSILRMQYRESFEGPTLMKPGEIYPITIDMPPTSNLFKKGHRIVVHLSSSNYPTYDPNPNTGDPYFMGVNRVTAENRIYHDAAHPSHILLPVVP
jgi:putative CocE/NonD family hydrolase